MSGAPARRQVVRALVERGVSETRACEAVDISRSSFRYESRRCDDVELVIGHSNTKHGRSPLAERGRRSQGRQDLYSEVFKHPRLLSQVELLR